MPEIIKLHTHYTFLADQPINMSTAYVTKRMAARLAKLAPEKAEVEKYHTSYHMVIPAGTRVVLTRFDIDRFGVDFYAMKLISTPDPLIEAVWKSCRLNIDVEFLEKMNLQQVERGA